VASSELGKARATILGAISRAATKKYEFAFMGCWVWGWSKNGEENGVGEFSEFCRGIITEREKFVND
jgi:hypothetical protein